MQTTFYIIYKTINQVNNKVYIGKHITKDLNDNYLGSGKYLKHAIDKYGVENFYREILYIFDNEEEMNNKERDLVTEEFVLEETNYNLCVGGQGGFSYINNQLQEKMIEVRKSNMRNFDNEIRRQSGSKTITENRKNSPPPPYKPPGWKHTEESKQKMSGPRPKSSGINNSQFGTMWITNGITARKIKKDDVIPNGWRKGRKNDAQ